MEESKTLRKTETARACQRSRKCLFKNRVFWDRLYINGEEQYEVGRPGIPAYSSIDVSKFAGQEAKLEFVFPKGPGGFYLFDIFGFVPIPEPEVFVLLAAGTVFLWFLRSKE